MGGWWGKKNDRLAMTALEAALELGINFFDTALVYGDGHCEKLLGNFIKNRREKIIIATKVPPKNYQWPAKETTPIQSAFPREWVIRCTEQSLRHLKTDYLDLQQLHVWTDAWIGEEDWASAFDELHRKGLVRHWGVSVNDHAPESALKLVSWGKVAEVQVIYNLFDQSPRKELLALCQEKKVGVIARVPFDEGSLTGQLSLETRFTKGDWRSEYFRGKRLIETVHRVTELKELLAQYDESLPGAALRFCLSNPAVSTVIPGMRRPEHVRTNGSVSNGQLFPSKLLNELSAHAWQRNFYVGTACSK